MTDKLSEKEIMEKENITDKDIAIVGYPECLICKKEKPIKGMWICVECYNNKPPKVLMQPCGYAEPANTLLCGVCVKDIPISEMQDKDICKACYEEVGRELECFEAQKAIRHIVGCKKCREFVIANKIPLILPPL